MPYYQNKFNAGVVGSTTGIIFSICKFMSLSLCATTVHCFSLDTIGGLTSPWIAGPITDKYGRRGGMFAGAIVIVVGETLS